MSHAFALSDEQYEIIKRAAESTGRTPEALCLAWAMEEEARYRRANPTQFETDERFRHLGATDEEIEEIKREVRQEAECPHDADA